MAKRKTELWSSPLLGFVANGYYAQRDEFVRDRLAPFLKSIDDEIDSVTYEAEENAFGAVRELLTITEYSGKDFTYRINLQTPAGIARDILVHRYGGASWED